MQSPLLYLHRFGNWKETSTVWFIDTRFRVGIFLCKSFDKKRTLYRCSKNNSVSVIVSVFHARWCFQDLCETTCPSHEIPHADNKWQSRAFYLDIIYKFKFAKKECALISNIINKPNLLRSYKFFHNNCGTALLQGKLIYFTEVYVER